MASRLTTCETPPIRQNHIVLRARLVVRTLAGERRRALPRYPQHPQRVQVGRVQIIYDERANQQSDVASSDHTLDPYRYESKPCPGPSPSEPTCPHSAAQGSRVETETVLDRTYTVRTSKYNHPTDSTDLP